MDAHRSLKLRRSDRS